MDNNSLVGQPLATARMSDSVANVPIITPAPHMHGSLLRRQARDQGEKPYPSEFTEITFAWQYHYIDEAGSTVCTWYLQNMRSLGHKQETYAFWHDRDTHRRDS